MVLVEDAWRSVNCFFRSLLSFSAATLAAVLAAIVSVNFLVATVCDCV